jgi:hypothetical protein
MRGELVHGCVLAEPDQEEGPCRNPFRAARWLKRALLLSTFTAWTAAAIAIAIALD